MTPNDIDKITDNTNGPCISITLPTDRVNKKSNHEALKKAITRVKVLLTARAIPQEMKVHLITELDRCTTRIPESLSDGLGVFISPVVSAVLVFPFEVKPNISVGQSFDLRDVLYLQQLGASYYVLNLSKKGVHLFSGSFDALEEIKDDHFPLVYEDQFEYERASVANGSSGSLKSFEKDKNQISAIRLKAVFRDADGLLKARLKPGDKVLLAGTQKMISLFANNSMLKNEVVGKISGSYHENNFNKLCDAAWAEVVRARKKEIGLRVKELRERNGYVAEGLPEAWNAAVEGKGLMLLVEKDLRLPAFRKANETGLRFQPPRKPYTVIPDAVDALIQTVRAKNGKVLFTENNQLREFDHVALELRY